MDIKICYKCGDISYSDKKTICVACQNLYDGEYINTYRNEEQWVTKYCNDKNINRDEFCPPKQPLSEQQDEEIKNYIREWFFEKGNDPDKYNEMLKRRRPAAIQEIINYEKEPGTYNPDDYGNYEVCSRCGNISNDSITGLCTQCGGELIDTGKLPTEWIKVYYEEHPDVPVDIGSCDDNVEDFIREIFLEELPNSTFVARVKAQKEKKSSTGSSYKGEPCPKCHSTNTGYDRRGFSVGKAVAATALTGFVDVGAVAGAVGRNKPVHVCHNCGHRWK